jgi:hypothetical protein
MHTFSRSMQATGFEPVSASGLRWQSRNWELRRFIHSRGVSGLEEVSFYFHLSDELGAGAPFRVGARLGTPEEKPLSGNSFLKQQLGL